MSEYNNESLIEMEAAIVTLEQQRDELVAALEYCKHQADSQRVWDGSGWKYPMYYKRIHDRAADVLAKVKP